MAAEIRRYRNGNYKIKYTNIQYAKSKTPWNNLQSELLCLVSDHFNRNEWELIENKLKRKKDSNVILCRTPLSV